MPYDNEVLDLVLAGACGSRGSENLVVVSLDDEVLDSRCRPDFYLVVVTIDAQVIYSGLQHALVRVVVVHCDRGRPLRAVRRLLMGRVMRGLVVACLMSLVVVARRLRVTSGGPRSLVVLVGVMLLDPLEDCLGLVRLLEYRVDVRQVDAIEHPLRDAGHPSSVKEVHVRVHFAFEMNY